jgi:hypothetical protein
MKRSIANSASLSRRHFLAGAGGLGLAGLLGASSWPARAGGLIELPFANGRRELVTNFPQKGAMILQRTRPPLLETPFEVFDQGAFTPNDRFYVRARRVTRLRRRCPFRRCCTRTDSTIT